FCEIVVDVAAITRAHTVGDLDEQGALSIEHQRERERARDQMRMNSALLHEQSILERMLPQGMSPLGERVASPDVVHENVEVTAFRTNAPAQPACFGGNGVVCPHGNSDTAARQHELGGFFDRLAALSAARETPADAASGAIHRRTRLTEGDCD